jgi:membrane dipeptidase
MKLNRREMLKASAIAAVAPMINLGTFELFGQSAQSSGKYSTRAIDLVRSTTTLDMLNPFSLYATLAPLMARQGAPQPRTWLNDPATFTQKDLATFRDSGIDVYYIAVGIGGANAYEDTLRFLALWNGFIAHHNDSLARVDSPESLAALKKSGKLGIILGLQNSEHFRTPADVALFHSLGQRISLLTYNSRNLIGTGSTERTDSGISDFGLEVIKRMNSVGMAVDVAHSGEMTSMDACTVSSQPVLITHANCKALCPHPRCKSDEAIKKMAATGGVMGITGVRMFVTAQEPTTIEDVLNHYDHVAKLVGVEHVGVGSDIDLYGYDALPGPMRAALHAAYKSSYAFRDKDDIEGLDHPKRFYDIAQGLIRRGYSDKDIAGILGGNFQRVLTKIWSVAPAVDPNQKYG